MTRPTPHNMTDDYDKLRSRWLNRYMKVQRLADRDLKIVLTQAAEDAFKELTSLSSKKTFSAGVQSAQIRIMTEVLRSILRELFEEEAEIIKDRNKDAAIAAVEAFTETDRNYLRRALSASSVSVSDFTEAQKRSATAGVVHAVQSLTREDKPLSSRIYRTQALANRWVKQRVVSGIARGIGAKAIADDVKKFIIPGVPGGVSYAAMRLGRTEINNAFHATSISLAEDRPWVEGMRWHLSKTHEFENRCQCNSYADQIFPIGSVPSKPHPQCRCFVTPEVEPYEIFLTNLTAGQYRSWIRDAA